MDLISSSDWNRLFPFHLRDYYSYENFAQAINRMKGSGFLRGSSSFRRREMAAFLANVAHESKELQYRNEINVTLTYKSGVGHRDKYYHGRGPIQLSWDFNYAAFSEAYYGNRNKLLNDPDELARNGVTGFASAIWFWTTSGCHDCMIEGRHGSWGFGYTIMKINGGIESDQSESDGGTVARRIVFYRIYAKYLVVEVGVNGEKLDTHNL